jgi:hypothetical protein
VVLYGIFRDARAEIGAVLGGGGGTSATRVADLVCWDGVLGEPEARTEKVARFTPEATGTVGQ